MSRVRRYATKVLPALVAALVLGGCVDDDKARTVDADQIEQQIVRDLSNSTTDIKSVSCPDDVDSKTGAKFTCSAKFDGGGSAKVAVTETDAPNEFTYEFKPGTVKLSGASVDAALEKELAANGAPDATVNCPSVIEVKTGTTVTCPVSGARGGAADVTFHFSDDSGSIDPSSVDAGA